MSIQTEQTAFAAVTEYEQERGRTVSRASRGSGFDLLSESQAGDSRHIEVKSTAKPALTERWLEPLEFERLQDDPLFYLYAVVDCAGTPRVFEFDRAAVRERYTVPITKHPLRFRRADFAA